MDGLLDGKAALELGSEAMFVDGLARSVAGTCAPRHVPSLAVADLGVAGPSSLWHRLGAAWQLLFRSPARPFHAHQRSQL